MRSTICASSLNTRPWSPSNTAFVKLSRSGRRQGTQGHGSAFVGREGRDLGLGRTKVSSRTTGPSRGCRQCWRATAATVATQFSVSRSRRIPTRGLCRLPSRTAFSRCTRQGPPIQKRTVQGSPVAGCSSTVTVLLRHDPHQVALGRRAFILGSHLRPGG